MNKKCRKSEEKIKKSKLLEACIGGDGDLFSELKKLRQTRSVVATSMDGVRENIEEHFKAKYKQLYNSADDGAELMRVQRETEALVTVSSLEDVLKVTPKIVKEAAHKLKPFKGDPVFFLLIALRMHQIHCLTSSLLLSRVSLSMVMSPRYSCLLH